MTAVQHGGQEQDRLQAEPIQQGTGAAARTKGGQPSADSLL